VSSIDRFAETVLRVEHRPVDAGFQGDRQHGPAQGIGLERVFADQLPELPGLRVGSVRLVVVGV